LSDRLISILPIPEPYARTPAILFDENNTTRFQRLAENYQCRLPWFSSFPLKINDCPHRHLRFFREIFAGPTQQGAAGATLHS
jgi:hypothetical protein